MSSGTRRLTQRRSDSLPSPGLRIIFQEVDSIGIGFQITYTFNIKATPFGNACADLSDIFGNDSAGVGLIETILLAQQIDQYAIVFFQKRHEDHGYIPFLVDESAELRNNKTFTASEIIRNNLVYHRPSNKLNAVSKITFFT